MVQYGCTWYNVAASQGDSIRFAPTILAREEGENNVAFQ